MHISLGRATLEAGFPQVKRPEFPIGGIPVGQHVQLSKNKQTNKKLQALAHCPTFVTRDKREAVDASSQYGYRPSHLPVKRVVSSLIFHVSQP